MSHLTIITGTVNTVRAILTAEVKELANMTRSISGAVVIMDTTVSTANTSNVPSTVRTAADASPTETTKHVTVPTVTPVHSVKMRHVLFNV